MAFQQTVVQALVVAAAAAGFIAATPAANAQVKPHTSGHPSYHAPTMRVNGDGFEYPNKPSHERYSPGYRAPTYKLFPMR